LVAPLLAVGCAGKVLDVGTSGNGTQGVNAIPPTPHYTGAGLGVVAALDEYVASIAADASGVYVGTENAGKILSLSLTGGAPTVLYSEEPWTQTTKDSIATDDDYVYFISGASSLNRVPKRGGPAQIIWKWLDEPMALAVDATHVYVILENDGQHETNKPYTGAIVRIPKAGGPLEMIASKLSEPSALVLSDTDVFFAAGYDVVDGTIGRVAKAGGAVKTLATGVNTQNGGRRATSRLALTGSEVAFVDPNSRRLGFVPIDGGPINLTTLGSLEPLTLAADGTTLIAISTDRDTNSGNLLQLDGTGATIGQLSTWSYATAQPAPPTQQLSFWMGATAVTAGTATVYWIEGGSNGDDLSRSIIRSAALH
jgi:hypothetical protein